MVEVGNKISRKLPQTRNSQKGRRADCSTTICEKDPEPKALITKKDMAAASQNSEKLIKQWKPEQMSSDDGRQAMQRQKTAPNPKPEKGKTCQLLTHNM